MKAAAIHSFIMMGLTVQPGMTPLCASSASSAPLVRQAKPGWSCGMKGAHRGNCSFTTVVDRAAGRVTDTSKPRKTKARAATLVNPIRPRNANAGGYPPRDGEA